MKFAEFLGRAAATGVKAVKTATPVVIKGTMICAKVTAKTARFVGDQAKQAVEAYRAEVANTSENTSEKEEVA